jgi:drug/metabolite transporter (DMT)-like permease
MGMATPVDEHPGDADAQRRTALLRLLLGACLIGSNGLMVRLSGLPPTVSAFWRMALAGVLFAAMVTFYRGWKPMPRRAWAWLAIPACAFALDLWLWHRSILIVGPGLATLLGNAQVFFMALAGALLFGERIGAAFVAGLALAAFGLWLLLGGDWASLPAQYRWGVWLGLATGFCYAVYNLGLKRTQSEARCDAPGAASTEQVLCYAAFGTALLLGIAVRAEGASYAIPNLRTLLILLALAGVGHCLAWSLISRAMARLPVTVIGLLLLLQPLVAFLLDVLVLHHDASGREWLGLGVALAGIFVAGMKRRPIPEPIA